MRVGHSSKCVFADPARKGRFAGMPEKWGRLGFPGNGQVTTELRELDLRQVILDKFAFRIAEGFGQGLSSLTRT